MKENRGEVEGHVKSAETWLGNPGGGDSRSHKTVLAQPEWPGYWRQVASITNHWPLPVRDLCEHPICYLGKSRAVHRRNSLPWSTGTLGHMSCFGQKNVTT